jgi:haloacetate dehalogenase
MIAADPAYWLDSQLGTRARIEPDVMADYIRCFSDPGTIAGSCSDYRAATDLADDDESFAARQKIGCPVLVLRGSHGFVGRAYEPLSLWQEYAADVRGTALPAGHFLPEEAPDLVLDALASFLGDTQRSDRERPVTAFRPPGCWPPSASSPAPRSPRLHR